MIYRYYRHFITATKNKNMNIFFIIDFKVIFRTWKVHCLKLVKDFARDKLKIVYLLRKNVFYTVSNEECKYLSLYIK